FWLRLGAMTLGHRPIPPTALLLPSRPQESYCAYSIILMALFWCTEALPLAVTALFPIVLYPMMGIMDASEVCVEYFKDSNILFVGGLLVAIAVEHWNLHKRIALRVLLITGGWRAWSGLMLGFMGVTAFLSMWISNTATTAMMVPIAHAVLQQLHKKPTGKDVEEGCDNPTFELQEASSQKEEPKLAEKGEARPRPAPTAPLAPKRGGGSALALGGTWGWAVTGHIVRQPASPFRLFPQNGNVVNFASWFGFAFPTMAILLLLSWLWLQILFLGFNFRKNFGFGGQAQERAQAAFRVIQTEHKRLGPMSFAEKAVSVLFVTLVVLWFTREPGFFLGWGNLAFPDEEGNSMASDATVAIFIGVILNPLALGDLSSSVWEIENPGRLKAPPALLNWKTVNEKMPWNIVILLGGGFALAKGSEVRGLSEWLGNKLTPLENVPPPAIALIVCLLVATFTECTSNVATTTLFLPILASLAQAICLHPLYVMLPCTLASSLAFMLPVATPPNAIVFSFGGLKVSDMVSSGGGLKASALLPALSFLLGGPRSSRKQPRFSELRVNPAWARGWGEDSGDVAP
uniref:Solute carrier family 13 member 2 n=1 Tax=Ursus maritimus TaxID=29073 RepID=A0A452U6K8_URSMA